MLISQKTPEQSNLDNPFTPVIRMGTIRMASKDHRGECRIPFSMKCGGSERFRMRGCKEERAAGPYYPLYHQLLKKHVYELLFSCHMLVRS